MMVFVAVIVMILLYYSISKAKSSYDQIKMTTDAFIQNQIDSVNLKDATEYLSEQARCYVINGDIKYLENYLSEAEQNKNREKAIDALRPMMKDTTSYPHLRVAFNFSNKMNEVEHHAISLALLARGIGTEKYGDVISDSMVNNMEKEMTPEEQLELARTLLFEDKYQGYKESMVENIQICMDELSDDMKAEQVSSAKNMTDALMEQRYLILLSFLLIILMVLVVWFFVIKPLVTNIEHINNHEYLDDYGLEEMRTLASTFNSMLTDVEDNQKMLSFEANHDGLTGLYNRKCYNEMIDEYVKKKICLLIVDVDDFKNINDTYGHDTGDIALKKVSSILTESFRREDMVFRLGGDEMAIVMMGVSSEQKELIAAKTAAIKNRLAQGDDVLPPISISVGAAFADGDIDAEKLYKCADMALYEAKKGEKGKLIFYDDTKGE